MADPAERLNQRVAKLKVMDFRLTPQRLAALRILAGNHQPSAERIFQEGRQEFPSMSLATV